MLAHSAALFMVLLLAGFAAAAAAAELGAASAKDAPVLAASSTPSCDVVRGRLRFADLWCEAAASRRLGAAAGASRRDRHGGRCLGKKWPPQVGHAHADTQESLFDHLLQIWGPEAPRTLVDIGASAVLGEFRNASDVHFFRARFPRGPTLAVEPVVPLAERLAASLASFSSGGGLGGGTGGLDVDVAQVFLDVVDDSTPQEVVLHFPPVVSGRTLRTSALISCCEENARHPQFVELHGRGVFTYCRTICEWSGREDVARWAVPRARWDTLWRERLRSRRIDFIKVDFDPGHRHWWKHVRLGWSDFLAARAFDVMVLELDERAYWDGLTELLAFFEALDYAVFLKWPCTPKRHDGGFQRTAYAPLSSRRPSLMEPSVPERIARGNDPHDLLILNRHRPSLFRLMELGNEACGTDFTKPWAPPPCSLGKGP